MAEGGSPLAQFVILAQSQTGKAVEALVKQALEHSAIFVFGELIDCPSVQALGQSPDGQKLLELLQIFAYGTYSDYQARSGELPELSTGQRRKLQLLTIVSLATKDKYIKFSSLQVAVDITNARELEDLIIESVYTNLIIGKMDQENQCLIVESCAVRDCKPEDIDYIIETLTSWHSSAQKSVESLDNMVAFTRDSSEKHRTGREELERLVQTTRESLKEGDMGSKAGGDGGCTRMSSDDADEESKRAKSTRGRWMGGIGSSARDR